VEFDRGAVAEATSYARSALAVLAVLEELGDRGRGGKPARCSLASWWKPTVTWRRGQFEAAERLAHQMTLTKPSRPRRCMAASLVTSTASRSRAVATMNRSQGSGRVEATVGSPKRSATAGVMGTGLRLVSAATTVSQTARTTSVGSFPLATKGL
jgi:hypothetical protein